MRSIFRAKNNHFALYTPFLDFEMFATITDRPETTHNRLLLSFLVNWLVDGRVNAKNRLRSDPVGFAACGN